ncbi:hypothetical protein D5018_19470 [Parashewanella curva]|uniref:Uncharacterized protein n=1 Tax=Parashewanella curva TaxID=2338552 RepID=A0A3L8PRI2_9GAMM|nr:hypothetical protein [Parashewanella curva]RLV58017.1 hypothetical protein D5018_19470 [Parashewanella curva]
MLQSFFQTGYQLAVSWGLLSEQGNETDIDTVMLGEQAYKIKLSPFNASWEQRFVVWLHNEDDVTPSNFSHTTLFTKELYVKLLTSPSISMVHKANSIADMQEDDMVYALIHSTYESLIVLLPLLAYQMNFKGEQEAFVHVCTKLANHDAIRHQIIQDFEKLSDIATRQFIAALEMGILPFLTFCSLEKVIMIWQESQTSKLKQEAVHRIVSLILARNFHGLNAFMRPSTRAESDATSKYLQYTITLPPLRKAIVLGLYQRQQQGYARRLFASNTEVLACDLDPKDCLPLLVFESSSDTLDFMFYSKIYGEEVFCDVIENLPCSALVDLVKSACGQSEQHEAMELVSLIINRCSPEKICEVAKKLTMLAFIQCLKVINDPNTKAIIILSLSPYRIGLFFQEIKTKELQQEFIEHVKSSDAILLSAKHKFREVDNQFLPIELIQLLALSNHRGVIDAL